MMKKNWQHSRAQQNCVDGQQVGAQQQRLDAGREDVIERGIAMQARYNTVCAIEYLKSRNVGADIIARVLLYPQSRRKGCG